MSTAERAPGRRPPAADLLTIGEVLGSLREDFPDITPSKVRFLEERGLVTPARTPSGYRKFAPAHVARLRLVLSLQRDHYLPLRVIGEHLAALDAGQDPPLPPASAPAQPAVPGPAAPEPAISEPVPVGADARGARPRARTPENRPAGRSPAEGPAPASTSSPAPEPAGEPAAAASPGAGQPSTPTAAPEHIDLTRGPTPATSPTPVPAPVARSRPAARLRAVPTVDALVEVAGGDLALVEALVAHGLLPRPLDTGDAEAAGQVVRAALALGQHGIEPRHLRVLRTAAEREAALVEQIAAPLRRVREGGEVDGRAEAVTAHLRETFGELRSALLVAELPPPTR